MCVNISFYFFASSLNVSSSYVRDLWPSSFPSFFVPRRKHRNPFRERASRYELASHRSRTTYSFELFLNCSSSFLFFRFSFLLSVCFYFYFFALRIRRVFCVFKPCERSPLRHAPDKHGGPKNHRDTFWFSIFALLGFIRNFCPFFYLTFLSSNFLEYKFRCLISGFETTLPPTRHRNFLSAVTNMRNASDDAKSLNSCFFPSPSLSLSVHNCILHRSMIFKNRSSTCLVHVSFSRSRVNHFRF